ncbi:restriction modification system DNA specificity domain-containing protein [Lelliottia amnigena]|uniref:restriction endonuclease subunit S n=2 Tax=Lelliottia amnigena TaxID=61646 RepID=UPI0007431941|nr:restriction endonuclease subunit S [Lelliottia amnigena]ATG02506.1 restriction endonuclease subunit S [Lelliottia amnigena]QXA22810.1 restriction endonuclease subunit S [Lelliottia amnigena]VDZ90674.1 restriction modification system DNA specificity domain-containing protein [Lelliottia amnigena]
MMVPKLRFAGFNSPWEKQPLGKVFGITSGSTPSRGKIEYFIDGDIPWVKTTDLNNSLIISTQEKVTEIAIRETSSLKILPKDTVFVAMYGGFNQIGRTGLLIKEATCNQALSAIKPNKEIVVPYFLLLYLNFKVEDWKLIAASSRKDPNITKKDVEKFQFIYPSINEQTKIADFLSSVDEKITLLNKQYELLCQYKKSMMQKIFCQKFRFKCENGKDYPEWETTELNEIASKVNKKNRDNSVSTVLTNSATQGIVSQQSYFEREIVTESNLTGYYVVNVGDFVYNPRISATAPVGPIKMNELSKGIMSPLYTVFRFNQGSLKFYQYFFESSVWHDYMKSVANSGARHDRMNISGADFLALPIPQPIEKEQTKIANFLSAIDDKITIKKAELDKLKTWKQGLLQQMFV